MSETESLRLIGGIIVLIGIVVILAGVSMPSTSTIHSETCVDSYTGIGQDCVSGSVTTSNFLRGPVIGTGFLALFAGIIIFLIPGSSSSDSEEDRVSKANPDGGFANKLQEYQDDSNSYSDKKL